MANQQQPNGKLIEGLNEVLNRELSTGIRYLVQSSLIRGLPNEPLREMYRRELGDEMRHAQYLADTPLVLSAHQTRLPSNGVVSHNLFVIVIHHWGGASRGQTQRASG